MQIKDERDTIARKKHYGLRHRVAGGSKVAIGLSAAVVSASQGNALCGHDDDG